MKEGHLNLKHFSRGSGHSAVQKAAYRAGGRLFDERLGLTHNYERKRFVEETFALAPAGAPEWVHQRERLWNAVEASESRVDARLATELEISLPIELSNEQQHELLGAFLSDHFVSRGRVADCCIHRPPGNPHAHVMLTTREITPDGFGLKRRDWNINERELKHVLRPAWELAANRALANAGSTQRICMASYADRGIGLKPQPKLFRNPRDAHLDGRDLPLQRAVAHHKIKRDNGAFLVRHPEQALELLTASGKRPTFSLADVRRLATRHSASDEQREELVAAVLDAPELVALGEDDRGRQRFTTRRIYEAEEALLQDAHILAQRREHPVKRSAVEATLASIRTVLGVDFDLGDDQAHAVRHVTLESGDLALVEGHAGTGKSTMIAAARHIWQKQGYQVVGAALAGKAAEGLELAAGIESRTLASWLMSWGHGKQLLTDKHVFVLDEAGMIGTAQFAAVLTHARSVGAKVIVIGDTKQLQAIEPGAPMRLLQSRHEPAVLSRIIRQREAWQKAATVQFARGEAAKAVGSYLEKGHVHDVGTRREALDALVSRWQGDRQGQPDKTAIMLAYRKDDVRALNEGARALRRAAGELGMAGAFETAGGPREFAVADRLYFLENNRKLGVKNGSLGTIVRIDGAVLTVRLDGAKADIAVDTLSYDAVDHGYAGTVHKGQGVTVDRAYVFASRDLEASASYVAMTRHRESVDLFYAREDFADRTALTKSLSRVRVATAAHEVGGRSREERAQDARLKRMQAFFQLSPTEQASRVDAERLIATSREVHAADVVAQDPPVHAAAVHVREIQSSMQRLEHRLARARQLQPDSAEVRAVQTALRQEQAALQRATKTLETLQSDPSRLERAREAARQHNAARAKAQIRWHELRGWMEEAQRSQEKRDRELEQHANAMNRARPGLNVRVATRTDAGTTFEQHQVAEVNGRMVVMFRNSRGERLLAFDDECTKPTEAKRSFVAGLFHRTPERSTPRGFDR